MKTRLIRFFTKSPARFFAGKALLLLLILFSLDYSLGNLFHYLYFHQQKGELYRITYAMEKSNEDLIVYGSSRADHHYHPDVFKKKLQLSFFNTGLEGEQIFFQYALLKGTLKRYTPKVVILDFTAGEFKKDRASYDRISNLLPYYADHPEIRDIIELRSPYEKYKLCSRLYPFNSEIVQITRNVIASRESKKENNEGYFPLYGTTEEDRKHIRFPEQYPIDSNKLRAYTSFILECKKAGTELFVICSPYYQDAENEEYSISVGKQIARKYGVDFHDFSHSEQFSNTAGYFSDPGHLNDTGARLFSEKVIDSISKSVNAPHFRLALR